MRSARRPCSPRLWPAWTPPMCGWCLVGCASVSWRKPDPGRPPTAQLDRAASRGTGGSGRARRDPRPVLGRAACRRPGAAARRHSGRDGGRSLRRGAALDAVGRHRLADRLRTAVGRGGLTARLAHRDLDAIVAFDAAARTEGQRGHTGAAAFLGHAARPADPPTRWPSAASATTRCGCSCPPGQGAGVAAGGRRARAGGQLARPPSARHAAPGGPDRAPRPGPAGVGARPAGRRATAVLRRLHPRTRATGGHRRRVHRRRRGTSSRGSSRSSIPTTRGIGSAMSPAGRADRCPWPGWSPSCGVPSPTRRPPSRCGGPRPSASRSWPRGRRSVRVPAADPATWWGYLYMCFSWVHFLPKKTLEQCFLSSI